MEPAKYICEPISNTFSYLLPEITIKWLILGQPLYDSIYSPYYLVYSCWSYVVLPPISICQQSQYLTDFFPLVRWCHSWMVPKHGSPQIRTLLQSFVWYYVLLHGTAILHGNDQHHIVFLCLHGTASFLWFFSAFSFAWFRLNLSDNFGVF